ncbi:MAG TPA: GNAT family N-acetyltransferase [Candidatus Nanopelagicaceae bacterium]|nr:GNAT family N-acetyltransferase [Candidatus Nanopelagicaceae bacterium]
MPESLMELVAPSGDYLESYKVALSRGWSSNNLRDVSVEELQRAEQDPQLIFDLANNPTGSGPLVELPDGSLVPRLPSITRWIWDGEFCGAIGLRWQPGTPELPAHALGHIGYAVVPWKQNMRYATNALGALLPDARKLGLPYVELTTDLDNEASQKVITNNGGILIEEFLKPASQGGTAGYRWRIPLA